MLLVRIFSQLTALTRLSPGEIDTYLCVCLCVCVCVTDTNVHVTFRSYFDLSLHLRLRFRISSRFFARAAQLCPSRLLLNRKVDKVSRAKMIRLYDV